MKIYRTIDVSQTLSSEVANDQRKLVSLVVATANFNTGGFLMTQLSNGSIDEFCEMVSSSALFFVLLKLLHTRSSPLSTLCYRLNHQLS